MPAEAPRRKKSDASAPFARRRQQLDHIVANVRGVVWEAFRTPRGELQRVDFVSPQLEAMLGYSSDEWLSRANFWLSIVHPEDHDRAARETARIFAGGRGGTVRFRWVGKSGRVLWMETQAVVVCDRKGRPTGMRGVTMDITARVEAEEATRRQETFTAAITSSLAEGICATDPEGKVTFLNPAGESMLGWPRDEIMGRNLHATIHFRHPDGSPYPEAECPLHRIGRSVAALRNHEDTFVRKDGTLFPVICTGAPMVVDGQVIGEVVTFHDISVARRTERRRAIRLRVAQVLAESAGMEEAARRILQALCEGLGWDAGALWIVDREKEVLRCLEFWAVPDRQLESLGKATRELAFRRGQSVLGCVWDSAAPLWIPDVARDDSIVRRSPAAEGGVRSQFAAPVLSGNEVRGALEFFSRESREPDEELLEMMATLGGQIGMFFERRRAEQETLLRNQDLKTLLYVISHDLKEPLRAVESFSGMLEARYLGSLDAGGQDLLRRVVRGAARLRRILDDILMLSRARQMAPPRDEIPGEALVREALLRLDQKVAESSATVRVAGDLPRLLVERTWATQAIFNLIANALKFTRPGMPPEIDIQAYLPRGSGPAGAGIMVSDRGPGVEPDQRERIFELFHRGVGREIEGTGAGLAIVREVALHHGGRVWVQDREGGGSEFVILFSGKHAEV